MAELSIKKLYYSISEVAEIVDLKQYVLRYWESEFEELKPIKNRAGNRVYTQEDIDKILYIKELLYDNKFTIEGAKQKLKEGNQESRAVKAEEAKKLINSLKSEIQSILDLMERD